MRQFFCRFFYGVFMMNEGKEIVLFRNQDDAAKLKILSERCVKDDRRLLYYRIFCGLISLLFLAFAVYAVVFFIRSGEVFQLGMLVYIAVPLIGAALPFAFEKLKRRDLVAQMCEEQDTVITVSDDRIIVQGSKKRRLVRKNDGKSVFEGSGTLFSDGDGKPIPFRYDIRLSELRYYAYDTEKGLLRFILGTEEYPDIILPENEAYAELCAELEKRGIKKTAYVK